MTELVPHPATGEAIDLSRPTEEIVGWFDQTAELIRTAYSAKSILSGEILRRMDADAKWTQQTEHYTFKASGSPELVPDWNPEAVEALRAVLADLEAEGHISSQARGDAIKAEVTYKAQTGVLKNIAKLSPEISDRIYDCAPLKEKTRSVTVKPRARS